jgi:DNA-binding GntR family transcriptional regulator
VGTRLKPVERAAALSEQVYEALRNELRAGRLQPGEPLAEASLAEHLGVSRTPVREALARLASEGLVVPQGRSFALPRLTPRDVEHVYELRRLLEPEAMRQAAGRSAGALAALDAALRDCATAHQAGDAAAFSAGNSRFREAWLALVPNRRLVHAIDLYSDHVRALRSLTLSDGTVRAGALAGMREIRAALAAGDARAAAQAMGHQLDRAERALRGTLSTAPAGGARSAVAA